MGKRPIGRMTGKHPGKGPKNIQHIITVPAGTNLNGGPASLSAISRKRPDKKKLRIKEIEEVNDGK